MSEDKLSAYQAILDASEDAIIVVDRGGLVTFWNAGAETLFGYSNEEMIGEPISVLEPEDRRGEIAVKVGEVVAGQPVRGFETRRRHKDGHLVEVSITVNRIYAEDGSVRETSAILRDITARKAAEREMRAGEDRLREISDHMNQVFWMQDAESFQVLHISAAYQKVWGRPREGLGDDPAQWIDPIHPDDKERVLAAFQEAVPHREFNIEYRIVWPDGSIRWLWDRGFPIHDVDGRITRYGGISEDITERRRVEEELLRHREELERLVEERTAELQQAQKMEAVGRLAGGIAHDYNNRLSVILHAADLGLAELEEGHPVHTHLRHILEAAQASAYLTRQILAFGRKQVLRPRVVDLGALVARAESMLEHVLPETIELRHRGPDESLCVRCDPTQIEQVLLNLAINARDAMPDGGVLEIGIEATESEQALEVCLRVRDTGAGMEPEVLSKIFEPFFTTKEVGRGTGLGLSVVHGIVEQSGGRIAVTSTPGAGTVFELRFPRVAEDPDSDAPARPESEPEEEVHSETVLLVEDDESVRLLTRLLLARSGYRILEAGTGEEALRICRDHEGTIHLMLTDVVMPVMNGREIAEKAAGIRPDMKVIFLSGHPEDALSRHGVLRPDTVFLAKPVDPKRLRRRIREVLDR